MTRQWMGQRKSNLFRSCTSAESNADKFSTNTLLRQKSPGRKGRKGSSSTEGTGPCSLTASDMNGMSLSTSDIQSETSHPKDSFIVVSTAGLSSMCSSVESFHSPESSCGKTLQRVRKASRFARINIRSARSKALLDGSESDCSGEDQLNSPRSSCTRVTLPCTPLTQDDEDHVSEFPDSTDTPQIQVCTSLSMPLASPDMASNCSSFSSHNSRVVERKLIKKNRYKLAIIAEKHYWKSCISGAAARDGPKSVRVAQLMCNLGNALLTCKEYAESLSTYKKAVRILRESHGHDSLFVANTLDKVGFVAALDPTKQNLDWALVALHEALIIRHAHLGPHHCDVVDTLNKIASIHLNKRDLEKARDAYIEVLTVRYAIFGRNHPSVAVTAQTLGRVYSSLSEFELSLKYMEIALKLFREEPMSLKDNHPLIVKLLKNIASTGRLMTSLGRNTMSSRIC